MIRTFVVSFVVFLCGAGFGILTTQPDHDDKAGTLVADVLDMLAVCETAIQAGQLPDFKGWAEARPLVPAIRSDVVYYSPPDTQLAVEFENRKFGNGRQLSCGIHVGGAFGPITPEVQSDLLRALLQLRGNRIASAEYEALPVTQLGQNFIMEGYRAKVARDGDCPVGVSIFSHPDPAGLTVKVADRFTWCDG